VIIEICRHTHELIFIRIYPRIGAEVAQSVQWLSTDWTTGVISPTGAEDFSSSLCIQTLEPTQPPVQWLPVFLSPGVKRGRGVMLTTHPYLVPRLRVSRSYASSPPSSNMACSRTALLYLSLNKGWKRDHFGDIRVGGRIILRRILEK
jgi:hypothetical protein